MFVSQAQKKDERALDIFEALDLDNGDTCDYFKEKCNEVTPDQLISLRDKRMGNEGRTLLHNAARAGSLSAVLHLLRLGHAVEPTDSSLSRVTPLMDAIAAQNVEIAIVLVESGANLASQDVNGENALHYAARCGSTRMVKWIIKASGLPRDEIQNLTRSTNIRLKFPEDVAANSMTKDVLVNFREFGNHASLFRRLTKKKSSYANMNY
jgi:ankyrin repeat protein